MEDKDTQYDHLPLHTKEKFKDKRKHNFHQNKKKWKTLTI